MKTHIDFQYLPLGADRPVDDGVIVGIESDQAVGTVVAPNVGDYVELVGNQEEHRRFSGKVKSRLFRYFLVGDEKVCSINIVVEETKDDWGKLIKE